MIIRIEAAGGSFRGAGLYYLHDKAPDRSMPKELKPTTDERVWFTDTRNCANFDPEKALDEMWLTAESQQWLKRANGIATSGRACVDPVKTISLSWHKDDRPSPEHMIEAADAYLKHMRWDTYQAVLLGHRDTDHRHLHIILNRVHPDTGRTMDDYKDRPRSQKFALAYEKEHGKLWCVEREINAARRDNRAPDLTHAAEPQQPANDPIPHNVIAILRPGERGYAADEKGRQDRFAEEKDELKAEHRAEREAWFKEGRALFKQMRHDIYDAVRAEYRADWAALYRDRADALKAAEAHSTTAMSRAFHSMKQGDWEKANAAYADRDAVRDDVARAFSERLSDLKAEQTADIRTRQDEALKQLRQTREADYQKLLAQHRDMTAAMRAAHAQGQSADFLLQPTYEAKAPVNENRSGIQGEAVPVTYQDQPDQKAPSQKSNDKNTVAGKSPLDTLRETILDSAPQRIVDNELGGRSATPDLPEVEPGPRTSKSPAELGAGAIGAAANYIADQLSELFAPTPPEVREQRAKEQAQRDAQAPGPDPASTALLDRHLEEAIREAQRAQEDKRSREYWTERDKSKGWERDR